MRTTNKVLRLLQIAALASSVAAYSGDGTYTKCKMNSVKIYSDNNCRNQKGEKTFDGETKFLGYNTGCHTIGDRSAWLSFVNGQIEA